MATHSSIPAWRIPQTEEPGGLQSVGSQSQTRLSRHACTHIPTHGGDVHNTYVVVSHSLPCLVTTQDSSGPWMMRRNPREVKWTR